MSCIGFLSPQQRRLLRASPRDGVLSTFRSPELTAGKLQRLKEMAGSHDPKIRESAALAYATPVEALMRLATDEDTGVRFSVARNDRTPPDVLRVLAHDYVAGVRAWVAANPSVPADVLDLLTDDEDQTVRGMVAWARRWPSVGSDSGRS